MSYFDKNPIKDKTIAKDCQDIFCRGYESKIRIACAINRNGNVIHHTVGIKDFKGKVHYSRIILN